MVGFFTRFRDSTEIGFWKFKKKKTRVSFHYLVISARIKRVLAISLLRVVFDAWHSVAVDARKTKEYFEVRNSGRVKIAIDLSLINVKRITHGSTFVEQQMVNRLLKALEKTRASKSSSCSKMRMHEAIFN